MIYFTSLYFLIGLQLVSLAIFILNYFFKINLSPEVGILFLVLFIAGLIFGLFQCSKFRQKQSTISWTIKEKIIVVLLCFIVVSVFISASKSTVTHWDAITLYDYRAKVILDTGSIEKSLVRAPINSYPLFTSLIHWWFYSIGFSTPMPLYPLIYGLFLSVSYFQFRRLINRTPALLSTLLLAIAPRMFEQSLVAYTNMPYAVYLILGAVYLYLWTLMHNKKDLVLGLAFSVMSLWIRSFPFLIAQLLLVLCFSKLPKMMKVSTILLGLIVAIYLVNPNIDLARFIKALDFLKWSVFKYYGGYWILFLLSLFQWLGNPKKIYYWPILIINYTLILLAGTYVYAINDPNLNAIPDTIQRTFMFINPAIIWFTVTVISSLPLPQSFFGSAKSSYSSPRQP